MPLSKRAVLQSDSDDSDAGEDAGGGGAADDPVVRELDVHLSQQASSSAYVLQFPLRTAGHGRSSAELPQVRSCRVKPKLQRMQLDVAVDVDSVNYDGSSELATRGGGSGSESDEMATEHEHMYQLTSTVVPPRTNYAIGVIRGDELHITALHGLLQLRPSFAHIDERDRLAREAQGEELDAPKVEEQPMPVQVQFKRVESERTLERRARSHANLMKREKAEEWAAVAVHQQDSAPSAQARSLLFTREQPEGAAEQPAPDIGAAEYVRLLTSGDARSAPVQPWLAATPEPRVSMQSIAAMRPEERTPAVIAQVHVMRFDRIAALVGCGAQPDEESLVKQLEAHASLVRGVWVANSDVVTSDYRRSVARDFVILRLLQHGELYKADLMREAQLSSEMASALLAEVAVLESNRRWVLKVEPDIEFVRRHRPLADRHRSGWLAKEQDIVAALQSTGNPAAMASSGSPARPRSRSRAAPPQTPQGMIGTTSAASAQASHQRRLLHRCIEALFRGHGICTQRYLVHHAAAQLGDRKDDAAFVSELLEEVAVPLGGGFALKTLNNPEVDQYRDVIVALFTEKDRLKRSDIRSACTQALGEDVPQHVYQVLMKEMAVSAAGSWLRKVPQDLS